MTTPLSIEVTLPASGLMGKNFWMEELVAVSVTYRAHRSAVASPGVVVAVTAATERHSTQTWYDGRFFVAPGLDSSPPPSWVPEAPEWFWAAAASMQKVGV